MASPQAGGFGRHSKLDDARQESPSLRVGVLVDTLRPQRWVRQALQQIRDAGDLELVLIVINRASTSKDSSRDTSWRTLLYRSWTWLDRTLHKSNADAFVPADVIPAEYTSEVIYISPGEVAPFASQFSSMEKIKEAGLDVIVKLTSLPVGDELAAAAAYGVWGFDTDDKGSPINECPPEVTAVEHGLAATEIRHLSGPHRGQLVDGAYFAADPTSHYRSENLRMWKRPGLLMHCLHAIDSASAPSALPAPSCPPRNSQTARYVARVVLGGVGRNVRRRVASEKWFVAVRKLVSPPISFTDMSDFKAIHAPQGRFFADPFLFEHDGKDYLFIEDYSYAKAKGLISCIPLDENGIGGDAKIVLETPYHLSYPFVFRHNGQIFMMPETSAARRLEVFRAVEFPHRWEHHAVLIDNIVAYDPTMIEHDGKFWLFVSGAMEHGGENDALSIFWSDDPFGRWRPHAQNPVVSDVRRARPAGSVFAHEGALYAPRQDCAQAYGRAVTLSRIEELTTTTYRETPVTRVEPEWFPGNRGTHTLNHNDRLQVIDGRVLSAHP